MFEHVSRPSWRGANRGGDFVELGFRLDNIDFCANGETTGQCMEDLTAANAELGTFASPLSASIGTIADLGTAYLLHRSHNCRIFDFTVDGMRGKLAYRMGGWTLNVYGGGPHPLNENWLAELEEKALRIKDYFFGKDRRLKVRSCSVVLYCHVNPDPSDTGSSSDVLLDFREGQITRAKGKYTPVLVPDLDEAWPSFSFGSPSGGRQVRLFGSPRAGKRVMLSAFNQEVLSPSKRVSHAELRQDARYQEGRSILCVEVIFQRPFIDIIARSSSSQGTKLNLPRLLQQLVRTTLGDGALPHPFFRVGTVETQHSPDFLRENSAPWERVRWAFLGAVAVSEQRAGAGGHL